MICSYLLITSSNYLCISFEGLYKHCIHINIAIGSSCNWRLKFSRKIECFVIFWRRLTTSKTQSQVLKLSCIHSFEETVTRLQREVIEKCAPSPLDYPMLPLPAHPPNHSLLETATWGSIPYLNDSNTPQMLSAIALQDRSNVVGTTDVDVYYVSPEVVTAALQPANLTETWLPY